MNYPETIEEDRRKLRNFLTPKERRKFSKNPVTKASIVHRYHDLRLRKLYPFGVPQTIVTPAQLVEIIQSSND